MIEDFRELVSTTLKELGRLYYANIAADLKAHQKLYESLVPPEERERRHKAYEKEQDRLAAIEAAKTPKQRLREKQAACRHNFVKRGWKRRCKICNLVVSSAAQRAYEDGFQKGRDAGREDYCE